MIQYMCRICNKPTGKKPNAFYCDQCGKDWNKYSARCFRIGKGNLHVWIRNNRIVRAMEDGEEVMEYEVR